MSNLAICRPCQLRLLGTSAKRSFATTNMKRAIPPESPDYVYVPKPVQTDQKSPRIVKGRLPVPREIFPSSKPEKLHKKFAERATPKPKIPFDLATATEEQKHKYRMSELRKDHLRKGLVELRSRKVKVEKQIAARSQFRREERARLIAQAEREDQRLTNSSVLKSMLPVKGQHISDPGWKERYDESVKKCKAALDRRSHARQNALHTLYMNARNFIVDERALDAEIAKVFPDGDDPAFQSTSSLEGKNIWNTGLPPTVADLLKKTATAEGIMQRRGALMANEEVSRISAERVKRLAGELSGGRI